MYGKMRLTKMQKEEKEQVLKVGGCLLQWGIEMKHGF
ncbi:hypothetical protein LCGC14_0596250 [marine sediment metagenome]|uniref:Uncharacterized protein n=1 Tax=marine sediment metagenome TaxID=412755 RepID=A0A0F9TY30_9ZZZZ